MPAAEKDTYSGRRARLLCGESLCTFNGAASGELQSDDGFGLTRDTDSRETGYILAFPNFNYTRYRLGESGIIRNA